MLSPNQLEAAGESVAAIYNDIEAKMLDHLVSSLITIENLDQRTITELAMLAQSHTKELQALIAKNSEVINDEVRAEAEKLIKASDRDDVKRIGGGQEMWPQQVSATVDGVARILARDNLQMVEGAKQAFLNVSIEAITRVNTGAMTTERALHSAVRTLEREGIPIITYQNSETGTITVENKIDVAVRRHIRTQIAQDGARLTMERLQSMDVALVEVSSHADSRPEHASWQGQVYSLHGDVEVDGHRYRDFTEATGYGSVSGLMGANCRHSFGPYRHGAPRAYEKDPKHPSGLSGAEVYELEQKQRLLERKIREAKREVRGAQQLFSKSDNLASRASLLKAQSKLKSCQDAMRDLIKDANAQAKQGTHVLTRNAKREWAGDMPKSVNLKASGRKLDDFLDGPGASTVKKSGMSKSSIRKAVRTELDARGGTVRDFSSMTASQQQSVLRSAVQKGAIDTSTSRGFVKAQKHADMYYEEMRNRDRKTVVSTIAERSSMTQDDARRAFEHLFVNEHELANGTGRFTPDYEIAQSVQRLIDQNEPLPHDLVLFPHENAEALAMEAGKSQQEAHRMANEEYNYQAKLLEYMKEIRNA